MLFSVIIPTYNRAGFLPKSIRSALEQTYSNFELIVVDDGSTDDTEQIVRSMADSRLYYYKIPNSERGFARNYGTSKAKGDYVTFLDSDDVLLPNYLTNAVEGITKYNKPPFFHLGYEIVNDDEKLLFKVDYIRSDDISCLIKGNPLSCTGCFLRADVARNFKFNEDRKLAGSEDWELWFRVLAAHGIKADNRVSARMYNHEHRSVTEEAQEDALVLRKELALRYAFADQQVRNHYQAHYAQIDAFGDGYISLHLALAGHKKRSFHYLKKFVRNYPRALFSKRFLVIAKYLILN